MRRAVPLLFFMGGSLLLVFGIGLVGAGFLLRGDPLPDGFSWKAPQSQVRNSDLDPATILLPLTGISSADALSAALDGGHWENAFALIAYDASLSDPARIGALLQLGTRYDAAGDKNKAAWCYLYAARIATLSPSLSDAVRADTFLQASSGLREIGALAAARLMVDQAFLVAQHSPVTRRESQSRQLTLVAKAYEALGTSELAAKARETAAGPVASAVEPAGLSWPDPFVLEAVAVTYPEEVRLAIITRKAAAKQLHDDVTDVKPNRVADWPADSVSQLREALEAEDRARETFYNRQLEMTNAEGVPNALGGVQMALLRDRVNWQSLKYRIAQGAFGADLVPEWTKARSAIAEAWSDTWGELWQVTRAEAEAVPSPRAASLAKQDVLRQILLTVRWSWYQGVTEKELRSDSQQVTEELQASAIPSLRLDSLSMEGKSIDWLVPDELFGKNEQSSPK